MTIATRNLQSDLSPAQREAVEHVGGPLLVLSGAGSGKTRTLTYRSAWLVRHGVPARSILVTTFTNRAANEFRHRLEGLLGSVAYDLHTGTLHSSGSRILRQYGHLGGFDPKFAIYDVRDSYRLLHQSAGILEIDKEKLSMAVAYEAITRYKEQLKTVEQVKEEARFSANPLARQLAAMYEQYQALLNEKGAMDFGDLVMNCVTLLQRAPEVAKRLNYRELLVDEFQDTDPAQFTMLRLLLQAGGNLTAVGDLDQAVYAFRGADHRIMLGFQEYFPNARIISLGQNYRSTRIIVAAAACVISRNQKRIPHDLWSERELGERLYTARLSDEIDEGVKIVREIQHLKKTRNLSYRDFAIIYRVNSQSASLEEQLMHAQIPYHVVGQPFFDRKEVRDVMLWLKTVGMPEDSASLEELLNRPARRVSNPSLSVLTERRRTKGQSLWEVLKEIEFIQIKPKEKQQLAQLRDQILDLRHQAASLTLPDLARRVLDTTGLREHYEKQETEAKARQGTSALGNIERFLQIAEDHFGGPALETLPELVAYAATMSQDGETSDQDAVQLMTIHAAKGSEFPVVFVAGCEERLLPHYRALNDPENRDDAIEEERRLFYVALTRAKDLLYLSWCAKRRIGDKQERSNCAYSRFLDDVPQEYTQRWEIRE